MKRWQDKGIRRLQNELHLCLESVGEAHRAAEEETVREEEYKQQKKNYAYLAELRGKDAANKLKKNKTPKKVKMKTISTQVENDLKENDDQFVNIKNYKSSKLKLSKDSKRSLELGIDAMENLSKPKSLTENEQNEPSTKLRDRFVFLQNNSESDESELLPISKKIHASRNALLISDNIDFQDKPLQNSGSTKLYNPNDFTVETSTSESLSLEPNRPVSVPQFNQVSQLLKRRQLSNLENQKNVRFNPNVLQEITLSPIDIPSELQTKLSSTNVSTRLTSLTNIIKAPSSIASTISPSKSHTATSNVRPRSKSESSKNSERVSKPKSTSTFDVPLKSVDMYDHWSRFGKQYPVPDNLVRREEYRPYEPSAMELAALEIEEDNKRIDRLEELKMLEKVRTEQAMQKEKIRKDRELLMSQLEILAKEEKQFRPQIPVRYLN